MIPSREELPDVLMTSDDWRSQPKKRAITREEAIQIVQDSVHCSVYLDDPIDSVYTCPFCGHRSLVIRPDNIWKCQNCHKVGDVFELSCELVGKGSYNTALFDLAKKAGIDVPIQGLWDYPFSEINTETT